MSILIRITVLCDAKDCDVQDTESYNYRTGETVRNYGVPDRWTEMRFGTFCPAHKVVVVDHDTTKS